MALFGIAMGAAAQSWQPLTPDGGEVWSLYALPGGSGRVFADAGNGLFLSTDGGRTWQAHARNVHGPFATDASTPATSYAFDPAGGLLRSTDFGDTWTPTSHLNTDMSVYGIEAIPGGLIYSGPGGAPRRSIDDGVTFGPVTGVPDGVWFERIASSPYTPEITAAGSDYNFYRSTDNGATWSLLSPSTAVGRANSLVYLSSLELVVSYDGYILFSGNGGITWTERLHLSGAQIVRVAPDAPAVVAMNGRECRVSSDGFATAGQIADCSTNLPTSPAVTQPVVYSLVSAKGANGQYRVLATDPLYGASATPAAPGSWTWTPSNAGLKARQTRGLAIAEGAMAPIWAGVFIQSRQVSPYFGPMLRSNDDGVTWINQFDDAAQTIRSIVIDPTTTADPSTMRVYAGGASVLRTSGFTDSGVWRSSNGGQLWLSLNAGLPESNLGGWSGFPITSVRKVMLDPRSCANPPATGPCTEGPLQTLFVISNGAGSSDTQRLRWRVARSVQQGDAHWTTATDGLPDILQDPMGVDLLFPVDIDADPIVGTLYVGMFSDSLNNDDSPRIRTIDSGVFRSTNGGASWTHASSGLPLYTGSATTTKDVYAITVHPRRAGVLWASTIQLDEASSQIHVSTDSGGHWTPVGSPLTGCDVRDLQVDTAAPDVLYAAGVATSGTGCLWRSEDAGATWTPLHGTLPAYAVYDVRQDPKDHRRLVVATDHGVWSVLAPSDRIFTDTGD